MRVGRGGRVRGIVHVLVGRRDGEHGQRSETGWHAQHRGSICDVVVVRMVVCMRGGRARDSGHVLADRRDDVHGRCSETGRHAKPRVSMCDVVVARVALCMRVGRGGRVRGIGHVRADRRDGVHGQRSETGGHS